MSGVRRLRRDAQPHTDDDLTVPHVELDRRVGEGAMAEVWRGRHTGLDAPVAVKFLRGPLVDHPIARARFKNEAAATARLRSPNVGQIFDHGVTPSGVPYIVMEWLEGRTLQDHCDDVGRLPIDETLDVLCQTARALARAHAAGIVHRDIKPDNIYLHEDAGERTIKLLDFGIALSLRDDGPDRVTGAGLVVGTPHFMSPEQMTASPDVGPTTDVWALGVVAYLCATGRLPYEGNNLAMLALQTARARPLPARAHAPEIPDALDAWIDKAMQLEPELRFADGAAMLEALEKIVAARRAAPAPYLIRARRTPTRRPDGWIVAAIAMAVVAMFYIFRRLTE